MNAIEIVENIRKVNSKIQMLIFSERAIPNELILEHNKLMNNYNEQKALSNGKQ